MDNFVSTRTRKNVCDNNCEPVDFTVETLTDASNFKFVDPFNGIGGLATLPLYKILDFCCEPFKDKKELFKEIDNLNKDNSNSSNFTDNKLEMILYRMFPSDYSSSFKIDYIAEDDFGRQFVVVALDNCANAIMSCTIDPDGMLKNEEDPGEYKDRIFREKKLKKDHIRELLRQIAILNYDINDLSIENETKYDEYLKEKQDVCRLKEEVWKFYIDEHYGGGQHIDTQVNEVASSESPASTNIPKRRKRLKKRTAVTNEKPMTIRYYKHGNNGLLKKQKGRVDILYKKWTEWGWIDENTQPDDFDRLFEGSPCHCNIIWTSTNATLTILLQELLKQDFVEKQTRCSAKHLVTKQFGKTANSSISRINTETEERISLSILILDTKNPLPERNSENTEEYDIQDAALCAIYEGKLKSTKGI